MKLCLTTACLLAVALGAPNQVPHSVQTDKKPVATAKVLEEKVEATMVHVALGKDQEAKLEKDVSEVEKMRKALMKAEKSETKSETVAKQAPAKVEDKKATVAKVALKAVAVAPKAAAPKAEASKAVAPKTVVPKPAAPVVAVSKAAAPKAAVHKAEAPKTELKAKEAKKPTPPKVQKMTAAAKMGERFAKSVAKGEKMAVEKLSAKTLKNTASTKSNLRRTSVMRPRNFAKTVAQWEAGNPTGPSHASRVHLSHPHVAALPVVNAMPWVSTTQAPASTNSSAPVAVNLGAQKKVDGDAASPAVIAKFTESAQASAERAQKHLEEAKKAFAKTSANVDQIHETGKKIEKTAGTIKYLYSTPKPPAPPTTAAPVPEVKSAASAPRSFVFAASILSLGVAALAC